MAIFSSTFKQEKEQPLVTKVFSAERNHAQEMIMFGYSIPMLVPQFQKSDKKVTKFNKKLTKI